MVATANQAEVGAQTDLLQLTLNEVQQEQRADVFSYRDAANNVEAADDFVEFDFAEFMAANSVLSAAQNADQVNTAPASTFVTMPAPPTVSGTGGSIPAFPFPTIGLLPQQLALVQSGQWYYNMQAKS